MAEAEKEGGTGRRARKKPQRLKSAAKVKIRMIGSLIGCTDRQCATVRGLGLRRLHQVVERQATPQVMGMVHKVPHLVEVVETETVAGTQRMGERESS